MPLAAPNFLGDKLARFFRKRVLRIVTPQNVEDLLLIVKDTAHLIP